MKKYFSFIILISILFLSCKSKNQDPYIQEALRIAEISYKRAISNEVDKLTTPIEKEIAEAMQNNDIKQVEILCEQNPQVIERTYSNENYYSIIHYAAVFDNVDAMETLLKFGCNPNLLSDEGISPLIYSVLSDLKMFGVRKIDSRIFELLLNAGADPNVHYDGQSLLMMIINKTLPYFNENIEKARLLIDSGLIDINEEDDNSYDALSYAFIYRYIDYIYLLLEKGAIAKSFFPCKSGDVETIETPCSCLRYCFYDLKSESYKKKLKCIEILKQQGFDYYTEPVPEVIEELIRSKYGYKADKILKEY